MRPPWPRWVAHQKLWSPKKGTMSVGRPTSAPAAVVPAPPWCTTPLQRGKSQLWGVWSMRQMLAGGVLLPNLPHPRFITARMPACTAAPEGQPSPGHLIGDGQSPWKEHEVIFVTVLLVHRRR